LLTIHRPANTDNQDALQEILSAMGSLNANIVWPVHPRNRSRIDSLDIPGNIHLFEPFSYFEMLAVLNGSRKVITDSGGLQKEAYWAKKPCVTVRPQTEWIETLENNWNILSSISSASIKSAIQMEIEESTWKPLYGDAKAALRITEKILEKFKSSGSDDKR
jgi:UDP-GlcNAc3NAcA epimerase